MPEKPRTMVSVWLEVEAGAMASEVSSTPPEITYERLIRLFHDRCGGPPVFGPKGMLNGSGEETREQIAQALRGACFDLLCGTEECWDALGDAERAGWLDDADAVLATLAHLKVKVQSDA